MPRVPSPSAQLKSFIAKFSPPNQRLIRAVRRRLRQRLPSAVELVYDNYNFFVIGLGPTERPSEAILSIAAASNGVSICLFHGARLPDPSHLLTGAGKQVRFLRIPDPAILSTPAAKALIDLTIARSPIPFPKGTRGKLVIRSIAAKQRPRQRPK